MNKKGSSFESFHSRQSHSQQVKSMLCDAIKVLCSNTIAYQKCLSIEALIGITVDNCEVILFSVQEVLEKAVTVVSEELDKCHLQMESDANHLIASNCGTLKADPDATEKLFDILSDEVIPIEDEEKKVLDDLHATISIKEEDNLDCLINDGDYDDIFQNGSQAQSDSSFMDSQFYLTNSVALSENCDQHSLGYNSKWETFPAEIMRAHTIPLRTIRPRMYSCRLCKKTFATQAIYLRHKKKYHVPGAKTTIASSFGSSNLIGEACNKSASEEHWSVASSQGNRNGVLSEEVTNLTLYTCSICGKTIRHQSSFLRHKRQHEGIVYKCDLCGTIISRRDALQVHKRKCAMRLQQMV